MIKFTKRVIAIAKHAGDLLVGLTPEDMEFVDHVSPPAVPFLSIPAEEGLKYFYALGQWWHCDRIFNFWAIDRDGRLYVYATCPIMNVRAEYWEEDLWEEDPLGRLCMPISPTDHDYPLWASSLRKI